ncbi:DNA/RNA non-specific endonuclease [Parabacteroides faecis]|uniref:DNA/RNA non-specific endonuclease n=1 Tax=Parabacteroides faecis TaxID=1217282 RepID=UPI0021640D57|nr:DNA/RNA non-specific endonuclease [Parabacteroides faecis]UVQ48410.1 DNA/RNA non-specific endonuclease [Parabacteroides faecis]
MAKRRSKAKSRKKKNQGSSLVSTIRRIFVLAALVVICFIGVLYVFNYLYPVSETKTVAVEQKKTSTPAKEKPAEKKSEPIIPSIPKTTTFKIPANAEIPKLQAKRSEQVIRHEGYTVSYNSDYKIANWVAYELTAEEAKSKKTERSNKFVPDPAVKGATATNEDYTRTGYDRGHLAPAGDMKWSAKAMRESFYFSNICPQKPGLNRGIWKDLEEQSRLWARDYGALLIATGPVITDSMKQMGKNRVGVPGAFYKVICYVSGNEYKAIAFILENRDYKKTSLKSMAIPVDSVEKVTGIDFFPAIPDEQEKTMESKIDWDSWSF